MISDDAKRQKAYKRLRKLTSDRVTRALGLSEEDLANLSLSALLNLLFLVHGESGSTGSFNVSFATALELFGVDLIWHEPEAKKPALAQRIQ
jgi:hypothetical protein